MNDESRLALDDAETPVNPYSLLAAVNASSHSANIAWLLFVAAMAYVFIAVAGVTHRDLLLNSDVVLPLLQVKISLVRFFVLAPILLVLLHVGLLGTLALLAAKAREFDQAVRLLESTDQRSHPLRLELGNFFFVQAVAGPERSRVVSAFLNGTGWLTLVIFPLALLLYIQLAFLPFHDAITTLVQRIIVLADIVAVAFIGIFLMRAEATYFAAFWRTTILNPGSLVFGAAVLAAAAILALFVATVPGAGREDRVSPFATADGALLGLFPRHLVVTDTNLVGGRDVTPGRRSLNLRGRDLRFAKLDRSDLRQADMTGANLDGASFAGADLRQVALRCDERTDLRRSENRETVPCASARAANFSGAKLAGADMAGLDVRGARFEGAGLQGVNLTNAQLTGVDFSRADLQRADLSGGTALQGASFEQANMQGADLSGARLQMADFTSATMQGATLALANLEGAVLRDAALDGANLQATKLFGADLRSARLHGADLSGALVWRTLPPSSDNTQAADIANVAISPPSEDDMARMRSVVEGLESGPAKVRLAGLMAPLSDAGPNGTWSGSSDALAWSSLAKSGETTLADGYRARMTEQLARLACRQRFGDGAVAAGIARRAVAQGFKGDVSALYDRLKAPDCPASVSMPADALRDLAAAADASRTP